MAFLEQRNATASKPCVAISMLDSNFRRERPIVNAGYPALRFADRIPAAPDPSDVSLVERMARGDRSALATLYERHAPRLLSLAVRILGRPSEAEDLLHDVFLEAWRQAETYSQERGSVGTWLSLRTRSRAIDRRRAGPRANLTPLNDLNQPEANDPATDPTRTSDHGKLREALACMSLEEQEVILLGYFEGLSSSEIAERVAAPIGTVKSRTRAALGKLRAFFAEKEGGP
jgi:RNA polymerase sigma-70 factor (ECF subfamily)